MRVNSSKAPNFTHEGAKASRLTPIQQLRRSVLSCLLWEDSFYEDGESIAKRIQDNAKRVAPEKLAALAIEARQNFHLRHVPLLLLLELSKTAKGIPGLTRNTVEAVISRADEMAELLAIHWKEGKKPVPNGILKGLRQAALKFDTYQLNKWDRDGTVKLRDVIHVAHIAFPDTERASLAANIVNRSRFPEVTKGGFRVQASLGLSGEPGLPTPETWEALIAAAGDNKGKRREIWVDLLQRALDRKPGALGYMAVLRNLNNFQKDGVSSDLVEAVIRARKGAWRVLPYRFTQAAKQAPAFYNALDEALKASIADAQPLPGTTGVCVDCSGSMHSPMSTFTRPDGRIGHSDTTLFDAAAALAGCVNGRTRLIAFGTSAKEIQPVQGLGTKIALEASGMGGGTNTHLAINQANKMDLDRLIVITDEQATQALPKPKAKHAYVINVASYKHGIGYGAYTHIDGFSASTLEYIREIEVS